MVEVLNRKGGKEAHFTPKDLKLLEAMATQASVSLQRSLLVELAEKEKLLPNVQTDEKLQLRELQSLSHTTQPPARFTEASLTQALEERGIGRPSTYASIIDTILRRDYVFKKGNALVPSWTAFAVIQLMEDHFPSLVD